MSNIYHKINFIEKKQNIYVFSYKKCELSNNFKTYFCTET